MKHIDSKTIVDITELVFPDISPFRLSCQITNSLEKGGAVGSPYPAFLTLSGKPVFDHAVIHIQNHDLKHIEDRADCFKFSVQGHWENELCQVKRHRSSAVTTLIKSHDFLDTANEEVIACLPLANAIYLEKITRDDAMAAELREVLARYSKEPLWRALSSTLLEVEADNVESVVPAWLDQTVIRSK